MQPRAHNSPINSFLTVGRDKITRQVHSTDIAVLKAQAAANKEAHDREFKQLQDSFKAVFAKLDDIEKALRK